MNFREEKEKMDFWDILLERVLPLILTIGFTIVFVLVVICCFKMLLG